VRPFKSSYSKPLPEGAKILRRKGGKYAKYRDKRGRLHEARLTKDGKKLLCETKLWHIGFEDNLGTSRDIKAYTNRQATQRLADLVQILLNKQLLTTDQYKFIEQLPTRIRKELIIFGLLDGQRTVAGKTLSDYIEDFEDYLTKKERNPKHIREITGTLRRIFRECGFVTWTDIKPEPLMNFLDGLRDEGRGISKRRYNGLLGTAKQFCGWMVKQRKATDSPIDYLDGLDNPQTDQRHRRRVLELGDFRRFLDAALRGPKNFGMTGRQRNFLYRFATETGLRSVDLHRIRVQDCNFEERKIIIEAGRIKNKQRSFVYLKPATALELKQYCANKLPTTKVFHLTDKTSKMVKSDLANADIPYVDSNGEYFDFHSLRHQSASLFGMNPDTPEAVRQQLTRHKSPEMARHYTHASEQQQRQAVEALPDLTQPSKETQAQVKTGTDNEILLKSCFGDAPTRTTMDSDGQAIIDKPKKAPIGANEKGMVRIPKPKVRGSSPLGRI